MKFYETRFDGIFWWVSLIQSAPSQVSEVREEASKSKADLKFDQFNGEVADEEAASNLNAVANPEDSGKTAPTSAGLLNSADALRVDLLRECAALR